MGLYLCDKDVIFKYLFEKDVALKYFGCRTKETGENRSVGCWSALKLNFFYLIIRNLGVQYKQMANTELHFISELAVPPPG